MTMSGYFKDCE